jgi:hypothetical protein
MSTPARPTPNGLPPVGPGHFCAAEGCTMRIPLRTVMCLKHWLMLPLILRNQIREAWTQGQDRDPSRASDHFRELLRQAQGAVARGEALIREHAE